VRATTPSYRSLDRAEARPSPLCVNSWRFNPRATYYRGPRAILSCNLSVTRARRIYRRHACTSLKIIASVFSLFRRVFFFFFYFFFAVCFVRKAITSVT